MTAKKKVPQQRLPMKCDVPGMKGQGNLHGPKTLFMSVHAGDANDDHGNKFELMYTIGGNPVIEHGKGDDRRSWSLSWQQLVEMAIENGVLDKTNGKAFA